MKRFLYSIGLFLFFIFYRKIDPSLKNRLFIFYFTIYFDDFFQKPITIKLKDINLQRSLNNKFSFFSEEDIIKFLSDNDIPYEKADLVKGNLSWSAEQLKLKENIIKGKYDESGKYKPPIINKNNYIVDGFHRITTLKDVYDGEHKIIVKKIKVGDFKIMWGTLLLTCIHKWGDYLEVDYKLTDIFKTPPYENSKNSPKKDVDNGFWLSLASEKKEEFIEFIDRWNKEYSDYKINYILK